MKRICVKCGYRHEYKARFSGDAFGHIGCPSCDGEMVRERPILFNTEMVRAILEGRKTQTRRSMKGNWFDFIGEDDFGVTMLDPELREHYIKFPLGIIGDRLWVRESWVELVSFYDEDGVFCPSEGKVFYKADGKPDFVLLDDNECELEDQNVKWKPSIHMPYSACRIHLEITNVRIERLQDISEEDAIAEGFRAGDHLYCHGIKTKSANEDFAFVWDSIYEKSGNSYCSNPWVWVYEFKRVD